MQTKLSHPTLRILLIFVFTISNLVSYCQSFSATGAMPLDLENATTNISGCSSNRSITFTVSGVGVLSATNQLLEIDLRLRTDRRLYGDAYLRAPDGTCIHIANRFGDPSSYNGQNILLDYKFRAPQPCLNKYPDYFPVTGQTYTNTSDSRSGVFSTVDNIATALNGVNADGTWTMFFGRSSSSNLPPIVISAGLTFGEPITVSPPDPNAGISCVNAIVWDGSPLCATTDGKVSTTNRPTTAGCSWMSTSENNLWIEFTPTSSNVCINISGINYVSGSPSGVQSIIVSPTNPGDPCAGTWNLENCPRDDVYASNVGSVTSQNHCFTATPGQTYYLVVDGNAGAITEVYITGINGLPVILAAELISFDYECNKEGLELKWLTSSESNNDYFSIEYSEDGDNWLEIGRERGMGNTSSISSYSHDINTNLIRGYYRLNQVDYDGKINRLKTIAVTKCDGDKEIKVIPNPSKGIVHLLDINENKIESVSVVNLVGNEVYTTEVLDNKNFLTIDLSSFPKGVYFINTYSNSSVKSTNKVIIE